jgi:hypothetical protein
MEGGRSTRGASDGDKFKGARAGAFRHAEQHGHSGVDVLESRAIEGGGRAGGAGDGDEIEVLGQEHPDTLCSGKNWSDAESSPKRCFDKERVRMYERKYIAPMLRR